METYELIRSGRKTLALEITRDCRVLVRAPRRLPKAQIDRFVAGHAAWIAQHLAEQRRRADLAPPAPMPAEIAALKERARRILMPKVAFWSEKMGLVPTGVKITAARTRYGSCSGKNSLCFSCFLANAPEAAVDLVVVHELCHRKELNHSAAFYVQVLRVFPEYRTWRRWLKENGPALLLQRGT